MASINMNLHLPAGRQALTLAEMEEMKSLGFRGAAKKALDSGYVVTMTVEDDDRSIDVVFEDQDSPMSMDEFFNILEQAEDESSK